MALSSESVTLANMKISTVDGGSDPSGGAFVDFGVAKVLTDYLGCLLKIKDSSENTIQGIIKAAGTVETYIEFLNDTGFDDNTKWTTIGTGWTVNNAGDSNAVGTAGTSSYLNQTIAGSSVGKLFYLTIGYNLTATRIYYSIGSADADVSLETGSGTLTIYRTSHLTGTTYGLYKNATGAGTFTSCSMQQVLTPSVTGVTIVNSKGGTTYNWINKSASFNYQSTTFTYEISATSTIGAIYHHRLRC